MRGGEGRGGERGHAAGCDVIPGYLEGYGNVDTANMNVSGLQTVTSNQSAVEKGSEPENMDGHSILILEHWTLFGACFLLRTVFYGFWSF